MQTTRPATAANTTPVIFRRWRGKEGTIFALFPTIPGGRAHLCLSYAHVGQHGDADYHHCIRQSRPAKPEEYAALLHELQNLVGYEDLKVYRREAYWMTHERTEEYYRMLKNPL